MNRHNAPPVSYPVSRSSFVGACLLALWLAGFSSMMVVLHRARHLDWRMALALLCVVLAAMAARSSWKNMPQGHLAWDGNAWRFERAGCQDEIARCTLMVIADCQHRLLLRLESQARTSLWLWVEREAVPERWLDLRRAVYSPHRSSKPWPRHDVLGDEPSSVPVPAMPVSITKRSTVIRGQCHEL